MNINKAIKALNSPTRRTILSVIKEEPLTVREIQDALRNHNVRLEYRQSVFKALGELTEAELVSKIYVKDKGICYKLARKKLIIDLTTLDQ